MSSIQADRDTPSLLPPAVDEWLPANPLARFMAEVIAQLDLSRLTQGYARRGSKAHHPAVLLALLVYGYATGVFSSRKIERATYDSVAFRSLAANTHPDHDTLATFRQRFLPELEERFVQVLSIAPAMKRLPLGQISLDGSQVKANASEHQALSHGHLEKIEAQRRQEVQALLAQAEATDRDERPDGLDLPAELARRAARLKVLVEAKAELDARAKARFDAEPPAYAATVARREAQRQTGPKPRGKEPQPPAAGPRAKDPVNLTDEASRLMPVSGGGFEPAYNVQAAVDTETMRVVATGVTQQTNDKQQVEPMLEAVAALLEALGQVAGAAMDHGYFSAAHVPACLDRKIEPLIALGREAHHLPREERFGPDAPEPATDDPVVRMAWRLRTQAGRALYAKRTATVEPVFGISKQAMGFRQFSLRGLAAATGAWTLVTLAVNRKPMHVLSLAGEGEPPRHLASTTPRPGVIAVSSAPDFAASRLCEILITGRATESIS
jgi:transposase